MTEKQITDEVDAYLNIQGIKYIAKNDSKNHYRAKDDGRPDRIIFLKNKKIICMEFKTLEKYQLKNNNLSEKQLEWKAYLKKHGYYYYIITDAEEAIKIIEAVK